MSDSGTVDVCGLQLPTALVMAIHDGRWTGPTDVQLLEQYFRDRPVQPTFYTIGAIEGETRAWREETDSDALNWYLGEPSEEHAPGDIDREMSLLIGDLGPDRPFALDYRLNSHQPKVIYLTSYNGWIEVAPSVERLLDVLGKP